MKKLKKISINPEKVIKNDELVNLRGGYGDETGCCVCYAGGIVRQVIAGSTEDDCEDDCKAISNGWFVGEWEC